MLPKKIGLEQSLDYAGIGILIVLSVLFILCVFVSMGWRMSMDTPILHYIVYLINQYDFIPYQDIFDNNVPGTYLLHSVITQLIGYGDFAFRCFDIMFLLLFSLITWFLLKRFGRIPALMAIVVFGLHYLNQGPNMSMQRDFVCILPITIGLLLVTGSFAKRHPNVTTLLVGALAGISASMKPAFMIGAIALVVYVFLENKGEQKWFHADSIRSFFRYSMLAASGFTVILMIPLLWVAAKSGFHDFIFTMRSYIPLYVQLNCELHLLEGADRTLYFIKNFFTLGMHVYSLRILIPASFGVFMAYSAHSQSQDKKKFILLLVSLCVIYSIYPVSQSKFWTTHYLPMQYFLILCMSFVFIPSVHKNPPAGMRAIGLLIFLVFAVTTIRPTRNFEQRLRGHGADTPNRGRVDEIANYLKANMKPGDTVQPLDFVRGAIQAMLIAKAKPATPYIYDLQFYHHISNPYIQELRRDLLIRMSAVKPRFVIRVTGRPWPSGRDTTRKFPKLDELLETRYHIVLEGEGYEVLERNLNEK